MVKKKADWAKYGNSYFQIYVYIFINNILCLQKYKNIILTPTKITFKFIISLRKLSLEQIQHRDTYLKFYFFTYVYFWANETQ